LQLIINQTNLLTMRKFQLLAGLLLITGFGLFTSCSKDDTTEDLTPSMNFIGGADYVDGNATMDAGAEFKFGINATANASSGAKLTNIKIVRTFDDTPTEVLNETINAANYNQTFTANAVSEVGTERWTFTITDKDGESKELAFVITTEATAGDIYTYTAVLLGGQENPTRGSFYSTVNDSVMIMGVANLTANQNKVDLIYYYGATKFASIVAPASAQLADVPAFKYITDLTAANHWTVTNQTKLKVVTGVVWADVINDALITANAVGLTDMNVNNLAIDKVVAFETAATSANPSKKGLFKVIAIDGNSPATRQITIEVKIQK
jgi:hypothetical protein